jgi:phosphohistidine phosphatase
MKTLLLLRHAKSDWDDPSLRDFDRPLAARGKRDAPEIGKALRKRGPFPI